MTDDLIARLDEYAAGLRQLQEQEEAALLDLQRRANTARKNVDRIKRAIFELTKDHPQRKRQAAKAVSMPSNETIDRVLCAIRDAKDEGATYEEIAEAANLSHDPVRRAVSVLREQEIVRRAGVRMPDRRHVFKMMVQPPVAEPAHA